MITKVYIAITCANLVRLLIRFYIYMRQTKVLQNSTRVPAILRGYMSKQQLESLRRYGLRKIDFAFTSDLVLDGVYMSSELYYRLYGIIWNFLYQLMYSSFSYPVVQNLSSLFSFMVITELYKVYRLVPLKVYNKIIFDKMSNYDVQNARFFVRQQKMAFFLSNVAMVYASMLVVEYNLFDILEVFAVLLISGIVMSFISVFGSVAYETSTELEDGHLKTSIEDLANTLNFPLDTIYIVTDCKHEHHSKVYFYGRWDAKCIVLLNSLFDENYTDGEIVALVAHEMGHWKYNHYNIKNYIYHVNFFLIHLFINFIHKYEIFYESFDLQLKERNLFIDFIIVITYVLPIYNSLFGLGFNMLFRKFEFKADKFVVDLDMASDLQQALLDLHLEDMGFPKNDWLYSCWWENVPPLLHRLNLIQQNVN